MNEANQVTVPQSRDVEANKPHHPPPRCPPSSPSPGVILFAQRLGELIGKWLAQGHDGPSGQ